MRNIIRRVWISWRINLDVHRPIMHPLLITFSLLCCVQLSSLHAQTLSNYQRDSICIYELGEKAFAMKSSAPDSALLLADQALELSKAIDDSTSQMSLLRIKGVIHYGQFRYAAALTYFEQAYAIAQRIGKSEGRLLINLGNVYYRRDEFKIALAQYKQALQLSEQKDTLVWMDAITNMGSVYDVLGDFERSIDYFNQALQLQQAIGNQLAQLPTISNIGFIHRRRNELEKSLETYETGIALAKTLNKHGWIAHFYAQIGASYQNKDYHFQALKAFQTALTVRDSLAQTRNVALLLRRIGETYHESGNQEAGLTYYQRSLALYEDLDDLHGKATVLNAIGKNLLKQARSAEAKAALHRSIATYRAGKISKHIMRPYYHLVLLYQQNGPLDSARYYLNAAYELA
ncbi:MAG: tetratricopeptide repeat protein, partial [Bacteroidota bacterium]